MRLPTPEASERVSPPPVKVGRSKRSTHRTASATTPFLFWRVRGTVDDGPIFLLVDFEYLAGSKIRRWAKITAAIDPDQIRMTAVVVDCLLLRHSPEGGGAWQLFLCSPAEWWGSIFVRLPI
jgi:hypothetical protein